MIDQGTLSKKLSGKYRQPWDSGSKKTQVGRIYGSPYAHGHLGDLKIPPPPAGLTWVAAADIPGRRDPDFGGAAIPIFAEETISWMGQPVLAACSQDADELDDWLSRIELPIGDQKEPKTLEDEFQRIKGDHKVKFSEAFQIIEENLIIPRDDRCIEFFGCSCLKNSAKYNVHIKTAWPALVHRTLCEVLGSAADQISVNSSSCVPGHTPQAQIWHPAYFASIASILSCKSGKSVRLKSSKGDGVFLPAWPGAEIHLRAAIDNSYGITALEADFQIDAGACFPFESEIIDRIVLALFGIYPCENYSIRGRIRRNQGPPSTFGPAAGYEIGFFAAELLASRISDISLKKASQWRLHALSANSHIMGPGIKRPKKFPLPELIKTVVKQSDYDRKSAAFEQIRLNRRTIIQSPGSFRGIGLSCACFGNGFLTHSKHIADARMSAVIDKNDTLIIECPISASKELIGAWSSIAAALLNIEEEGIKINKMGSEQDPGIKPVNGPVILGRHVSDYTELLQSLCKDLAMRREREEFPIHAEGKKQRRVKHQWNAKRYEGSVSDTYSLGAAVVELTLSIPDFSLTSLQVNLSIDAGQLLVPDSALAAVEISAEEAISWCIGRKQGKLRPKINVAFYQGDSAKNSKDASTIPWLLIPPALIRALRQASNIDIDRIPVSLNTYRNGVSLT